MDRSSDGSPRNRGTILPPSRSRDAPARSLRDELAAIAPDLRAPSSPGYQVFAVDGPHLRSVHLAPVAGDFAVVGRHTACDLALLDDPSVSLRHLLLRAVRLEHGALALRVIDLATPQGFRTDEEASLAAVLAEGPFAFRVGRSALFAVPWGAVVSPVLPAAVSARSQSVPRLLAPSRPPSDAVSPSSWRSLVTLVPPPSSTEAGCPPAVGERILALRSGEEGIDVAKSLAALASGVLLGRYERCDSGARRLMGEGISRVHALLLHEGGEDFVFDLASTNGTEHDGARVRRAALEDGDRLVLAPECPNPLHVTWRHRSRGRRPIVWN